MKGEVIAHKGDGVDIYFQDDTTGKRLFVAKMTLFEAKKLRTALNLAFVWLEEKGNDHTFVWPLDLEAEE